MIQLILCKKIKGVPTIRLYKLPHPPLSKTTFKGLKPLVVMDIHNKGF
jgi:hypothetical protein